MFTTDGIHYPVDVHSPHHRMAYLADVHSPDRSIAYIADVQTTV